MLESFDKFLAAKFAACFMPDNVSVTCENNECKISPDISYITIKYHLSRGRDDYLYSSRPFHNKNKHGLSTTLKSLAMVRLNKVRLQDRPLFGILIN